MEGEKGRIYNNMKREKIEIDVETLCICYDKEDLEDFYYNERFKVNNLQSLKKYSRIALREAIKHYYDEKYIEIRKQVIEEAKKGTFIVNMTINNFVTEMSEEEMQQYITKALRYSQLTVTEIKVKNVI